MFECLKIYPESRTIKSLDPTVALDWGGQAYSNKAIADSGGVTFGGGNPGNKTKAYGGQKAYDMAYMMNGKYQIKLHQKAYL
mmetsp:Transcript_40641/g.96257  ORF Transcript_40641/g.96257 Transcript_40641/m.96257 type:complete len:82 (-) Transcript_40641:424-669(-)